MLLLPLAATQLQQKELIQHPFRSLAGVSSLMLMLMLLLLLLVLLLVLRPRRLILVGR